MRVQLRHRRAHAGITTRGGLGGLLGMRVGRKRDQAGNDENDRAHGHLPTREGTRRALGLPVGIRGTRASLHAPAAGRSLLVVQQLLADVAVGLGGQEGGYVGVLEELLRVVPALLLEPQVVDGLVRLAAQGVHVGEVVR